MDPELCLREAKQGFHGGSIQLDFHGQPVDIDDRIFALADSTEAPVEPEDAMAVAVARMVRQLGPTDIMRLQVRAEQGDTRSERVYHAYMLGQLCQMRRAAKRLVERAAGGDEAAKRSIEAMYATALDHRSPMQKKAELSTRLIRDVMTEVKRAGLQDVAEKVETVTEDKGKAVAKPEPTSLVTSACSNGHPSDIFCAECEGVAR